MHPVDNSQFTEEQRAEAYRVESMQQQMQQTETLKSIRHILLGATIAVVIIGIMVLYFLSSLSR